MGDADRRSQIRPAISASEGRDPIASLHHQRVASGNRCAREYDLQLRFSFNPSRQSGNRGTDERRGRTPAKAVFADGCGTRLLLRRNALVVSLLQGERGSGTTPILPTTPAVIAPAVQSTPDVATWYSSATAGGGQSSPALPVSPKRDDQSDEDRAAAY